MSSIYGILRGPIAGTPVLPENPSKLNVFILHQNPSGFVPRIVIKSVKTGHKNGPGIWNCQIRRFQPQPYRVRRWLYSIGRKRATPRGARSVAEVRLRLETRRPRRVQAAERPDAQGRPCPARDVCASGDNNQDSWRRFSLGAFLAQHNDIIQTLLANRADYPLRVGIPPGTPGSDKHSLLRPNSYKFSIQRLR